MVVGPDTVVDPGAVVVKSFNTAVAHTAMTGFLSSDHFAVRAQQNGIEFFKNFHKSNVLWILEVPRIHAHSHNM